VVEVSGGDVATLAASKRDFDRAKAKVAHPVLWDKGNANHKLYGVTEWPYAVLVGPDGRVFWQGDPARLRHRADDRDDIRHRLDEQLGRVARPAVDR
jgi:hypothetical protein